MAERRGEVNDKTPLAPGRSTNPFDEDSPARSPGKDPETGGERSAVEEEYKPCLIRYITALSRFAGLVTLVVLWLFTGLLLKHVNNYKYAPWYILSISILMTLFETIWIVNKCVVACMRQDGCCCRFWRFLVWIDNWRKSILYLAFAIPCFLNDIVTTETIIGGLLLLVTATFYFIKSFKDSACVNRRRYNHAVVQTSPKTRVVAHDVQVGRNGSQTTDYRSTHSSPPSSVRSTHTSPSPVQPKEEQSVSSGPNLDPSGKKRLRYSSSTDEEGKSLAPRRSPDYHDGDRRDRYDDRDRGRRDRYEDRDRSDRYDSRRDYGDRDRREYGDRDVSDRYNNARDRKGDRRGRDRRDSYDRDDHYPESDRRDSPNRHDEKRSSQRDSPRDSPKDRTRAASPIHTTQPKEKPQQSPPTKDKTPKTEAAPVKASEPPPLKELPPQASEAMKKSAAAGLVKQVSSGSPIDTRLGSAPSGMPTKLEQKAARMSNPYEQSKPAAENPFDEPDDDEYFD